MAMMLAQTWIESLQEQGIGTSLLMGGAAMIAVWLMMRGRLRRDHEAHNKSTPADRIAQIKQTHGVRDDLTRMMVELEEMARHVSSQLDMRQAELERLIQEAEERTDRLEALLNACGALPKPVAESPARVTPSETVDARTQQIYAMADEGRTSVEIASALEDQVGKIELILALRSSRS